MKIIRGGMIVLTALGMGAVASCAADNTDLVNEQDALVDEVQVGRLRLPLVTAQQATFRLRQASFAVRSSLSNIVVATLDSEADPAATQLTVDLNPGQYSVTLAPAWVLERLEADGSATPINAALVTANPATVQVQNGQVAELTYTFTTADGEVTLGGGSLAIDVNVVEPEVLTACTVTPFFSNCPFPQTCLLADDTGRGFCASPGNLPEGAACDSQQCVAGTQCLSAGAGAPSVCTRFCDPSRIEFGCNCTSLGFNGQVGICAAPPAGTCDLLTQTGCAAGESCRHESGSFATCGVPGDVPRGGACLGEVCEAGLDCHGGDPANGVPGVCAAICDLQAFSFCEPPPGVSFSFCSSAGTGNAGRCEDFI